MEYKYLPKVTSVYFYQLTWGNVSTNSLVFIYIFAAYWVRVKLHGAQTHRAAQRVPGWRVVARPRVTGSGGPLEGELSG